MITITSAMSPFLKRSITIVMVFFCFNFSFGNHQLLDSCRLNIESKDYFKASINLSSYLNTDVRHKNITTFYLGIITYHLDFHNRSETSFLKFIELDSEHSEYYDSAFTYLVNLSKQTGNQNLHDQICNQLGPLDESTACNTCEGHGSTSHECMYCKGDGDELCSNCSGSGVVIEYSNFGNIYKTCPICDGSSYTSCNECRGSGITKGICHECEGSGQKHKERDCELIAKQIDAIRERED